ncbi:hypothetical protein AVEN_34582-1 [Araneus ventricosus]|uniref:Uncharacterized protein n=1 Tax=Araneus ventricosus TaxID=182803 RepID=A0A4Y2B281_ARAVE|nr:hypothetical protein AVEN_34582-1 [Araneus ventricosus]
MKGIATPGKNSLSSAFESAARSMPNDSGSHQKCIESISESPEHRKNCLFRDWPTGVTQEPLHYKRHPRPEVGEEGFIPTHSSHLGGWSSGLHLKLNPSTAKSSQNLSTCIYGGLLTN